MTIDWKAAWAFIVARLNERTTWLGLIAIAAAFGYSVAPEHVELIVQSGLVAAGFIAVAVKEKPAVTNVVLMASA